MVVAEKSNYGDEVEDESIYISLELIEIKNYSFENFARQGKVIVECTLKIKEGDKIIIYDGGFLEFININGMQQLHQILNHGAKLIGKIKCLETKLT